MLDIFHSIPSVDNNLVKNQVQINPKSSSTHEIDKISDSKLDYPIVDKIIQKTNNAKLPPMSPKIKVLRTNHVTLPKPDIITPIISPIEQSSVKNEEKVETPLPSEFSSIVVTSKNVVNQASLPFSECFSGVTLVTDGSGENRKNSVKNDFKNLENSRVSTTLFY